VLEAKLYMDCCNAKERNGTEWFGLEILKLGVIMKGAVKGGCPLRKEEEWSTYYYYFQLTHCSFQGLLCDPG
jgi:hypothetical protein